MARLDGDTPDKVLDQENTLINFLSPFQVNPSLCTALMTAQTSE
jgi:hypothetical protein